MSLEIDYKSYLAIKDKGIEFISHGQRYLIVDSVMLVVQPTNREYQDETINTEDLYR